MARQESGRKTAFEIADPNTEQLLLPTSYVTADNSRQIHHYKLALRQAKEKCLTPVQREQFELYYSQNLRKTQIAAKQNSSCSAVSKSMKAGEKALREYIELYMGIFRALEREFLREETR